MDEDEAGGEQRAPSDDILTLDEAAQFLGTSRPTLYRVLATGDLKGLKVGRQWRFRRPDLQAYMERNPVAAAAAPQEALQAELEFFRPESDDASGPAGLEAEGGALATEQRVALLADRIVSGAIAARASDIHMEPARGDDEPYLWLRYRVDGRLVEMRRIAMSLAEALTLRFKQMGEMNLSERRIAQDGRFVVQRADADLEVRISTMPMLAGESMVMRILNRDRVLVGLANLGMYADDIERLRAAIHQPSGLIVVTGPTGSGKTTTVYCCLTELASPDVKTITVEDPVELAIPDVTQTQINVRTGMTFVACLRTAMRQDPDILYCAELRNQESAQAVVEAALTGHLAFAAMHAGDAVSAIARLIEIGIEPFLVSGALLSVVVQRLVRTICMNCKTNAGPPPAQTAARLRRLSAAGGYTLAASTTYSRGAGCEQCRGTGYRGRMALFEVLTATPELSGAITSRAPVDELTDLAVAGGMRTLLANGMRMAAEGLTSWEEVVRVLGGSV